MRFTRTFLFAAVTASAALFGKPHYPESPRQAQVDKLHGFEITDPYRWLEDNDSAAVKAWVESQRKVTDKYLESLPGRDILVERLTELAAFTAQTVPWTKKGWYYWSRKEPGDNHYVICRGRAPYVEPQIIIDPNAFSVDGTVSLSDYSISPTGSRMVYATSDGGSDWLTWKVRELDSLTDHQDVINWGKFSSAAWSPDGEGFFYGSFDPTAGNGLTDANKHHKLYYHKLGTPQSTDSLVLESPDQPDRIFSPALFSDRYLVVSVQDGCSANNGVYYRDLLSSDSEFVKLLDQFDASYDVLSVEGHYVYVRTTHSAPLGRLVRIDLEHPQVEYWVNMIPECEQKLEGVVRINNKYWAAEYLKDVHSQLLLFDDNKALVKEITLPSKGCLGAVCAVEQADTLHFGFSNPITPPSVYAYDIAANKVELVYQADIDFNPADYITTQLFYFSKDGTKIPMFISHKRNLLSDGSNPTLLYGYGGFNISIPPTFSWGILAWLEMGGVFCVANIRGGGEYGEEWHQAGMLDNKQNVFDDFIAAAEFLVREKVTSPEKLAIMGGSNGGLLIGACMNQRPELFGACIPAVGVMDMLRFHKFTIGSAWITDYGSPDDPKDFEILRAYSPYHNLQKGMHYPATLVLTADHDDRVVPAHSFKYIAQLQYCQADDAPVLIRIEERAGHGAGKSTEKQIEEYADKWAFLVHNLKAECLLIDVKPNKRRLCCCNY